MSLAEHRVVETKPRTILTFDIQSFNSPVRTDPDRAAMRAATQRLMTKVLKRVLGDGRRYWFQDTGDGGMFLIDPLQPKADISGIVVPEILRALKRYNAAAPPERAMRWRLAVHFGDVSMEHDSTGAIMGASSEAINYTFRIQDADLVRQSLISASAFGVLVASAQYYDNVIKHNHPTSELVRADFREAEIQSKETTTKVWILRDEAAERVSQRRAKTKENSRKNTLTRMELNQLPAGVVYMGISDIHNYALYQREHNPPPLDQQLDCGLLLADRLVLHCADPLRSRQVAALLSDYEDLVADGTILFLLGENAVDPAGDFRAYIDLKINQYAREAPGGRDVESLEAVDTRDWERTQALLHKTPVALTRGYSGTDRFVSMVSRDLRHTEAVTTREPLSSSLLAAAPLSLRQLLTWQQMTDDGRLLPRACSDDDLRQLHDSVAAAAQRRSFSRNILIDLIQRHAPGLVNQEFLTTRIMERVALLHLRSTIGNLPFLEVTRSRDARSPYFHHLLMQHLAAISRRNPPSRVGPRLVSELRALPAWPAFRQFHFAAIARGAALVDGLAEERLQDMWRETAQLSASLEVARLLRREWA